MISKEFFLALDELEELKGISKEKVIESLETALTIACKKNYEGVLIAFDKDTFTVELKNGKHIIFNKKDTAKVEPVIEF